MASPQKKSARQKAPLISQLKQMATGMQASMSRKYYDQSTKKSFINISMAVNPFQSVKPIGDNVLFKKVGEEDMINLENMTNETLSDNLKRRYNEDLVYTRVHSILVAINPFKMLPIYSAHVIKKYVGKTLNQMPPHIFGVTEYAYNSMRSESKNQSIVISGESGAGKSESCRLALQFLSGRSDRSALAQSASESSHVETLILETVPVLEALGNAKTIRNNNSSRFGKYIEIQFNRGGSICGARLTSYLLEKSRVCFQALDERNYHIFYQMTEGTDQTEKQKYFLTKAAGFNYLNQSGCVSIEGVNEQNEWTQFKQGLTVLKIAEQDNIFKIFAAVLHLGNIAITKVGDKASIDISDPALQHAAQLLSISPEILKKGLLEKLVVMGAEKITMHLTPEQATASRDALAKILYSRLFDWLIVKINALIHRPDAANFMGILDIFGFEHFKVNSFEQFCINFTNERLQFFFNHNIFKMEQEEYDREKIDWSSIEFKDNQKCIDLIEGMKPPGIMPLLDEQSRFPKATDLTFLDLVKSLDKNEHYAKTNVKDRTPKFGVNHYAGTVYYDVANFLEKNRDQVPEHFPTLFKTNSNNVLQILFKEPEQAPAPGPAGPGKAGTGAAARRNARVTPTVAANFRKQLTELMQLLSSTTPYFVRCIKPNMAKTPNTWDNEHIGEQLAYSGMYETIKIRRMGYPTRFIHNDFVQRYKCLAPASANSVKTLVSALATTVTDRSGIQCGVSKVFLRHSEALELEGRRGEAMKTHATKVQTWWRMAFQRMGFLKKVVQEAEEKRLREEAEAKAKAAAAEAANNTKHSLPEQTIPVVPVVSPPKTSRLQELEAEVARLEARLASMPAGGQTVVKKLNTGGKGIKKSTRRRHRRDEEFQDLVWTVMDGLSETEIIRRALDKDNILIEQTLGAF